MKKNDMKRIEKLIHKFKLFNWNIGFVRNDIENILSEQKIVLEINWVKHSYRDRFFADPFILSISDNEIHVLVEEFFYKEWKGIITLLCIDKMSYEIINRKVLLDLPTHLSFPFIYRENEKIYVLPENSQSGKLTLYKYHADSISLEFEKIILDVPAVDSVILKEGGRYYLFCTVSGRHTDSDLHVYYSDSLLGAFIPFKKNPIKSDLMSSRLAGDFLRYGENIYKISQKCSPSYGCGLVFSKINALSPDNFEETAIRVAYPVHPYPRGLHTCNTYKGVTVIDGLTTLFSPLVFFKIKRSLRIRSTKL
jgi:hypothetical protein